MAAQRAGLPSPDIETNAPYGASEPCLGASDFFSSPNHWRILAIKLPMHQSYARLTFR